MKRSHRSLLISLGVVILALGSLWIYQNKPKQVVPEHSDISLLCWPTDEIAAFEIQNKEGKRGFRRQGEVWKSEEGVPIDSPKLDVQLAQLRQSVFRPNRELQIEHTGIEGSADHWIFQSESERCLIELGLVNQVTGERLIRRQFHSADLGSVAQKSLLRLDWDLAADRLAYIDQGAMTSIHLAPEIADSLQFDRQRGFWRVRQGDFEMIGDEEAIKEAFESQASAAEESRELCELFGFDAGGRHDDRRHRLLSLITGPPSRRRIGWLDLLLQVHAAGAQSFDDLEPADLEVAELEGYRYRL